MKGSLNLRLYMLGITLFAVGLLGDCILLSGTVYPPTLVNVCTAAAVVGGVLLLGLLVCDVVKWWKSIPNH